MRVPWHDTAWDGRVCASPKLNGSCLQLKGIGQNRDDNAEEAVAGMSLNVLSPDRWPCCIGERMSFMAPFEILQRKVHPYAWDKEGPHAHFAETDLPPYSVPLPMLGQRLPCVPSEGCAAERSRPLMGD